MAEIVTFVAWSRGVAYDRIHNCGIELYHWQAHVRELTWSQWVWKRLLSKHKNENLKYAVLQLFRIILNTTGEVV